MTTLSRLPVRLALVLLAIAVLAACGLKGDLVLPEEPAGEEAPAKSE